MAGGCGGAMPRRMARGTGFFLAAAHLTLDYPGATVTVASHQRRGDVVSRLMLAGVAHGWLYSGGILLL